MKRKFAMLAFAALLGYFSLAAQASVGRDDGGWAKSPGRRTAGGVFHFPKSHEKRYMTCTWGCANGTGGSATVMMVETCEAICSAACGGPCGWG
jgi:hypothetical protein